MTSFSDLILEFITFFEASLSENRFVKLSLDHYQGSENGLKSIHIRRILMKNEEKLSFTYRYKTRDIIKNYSKSDAVLNLHDALQNGFQSGTLYTTAFDIIFHHKGLKQKPATHPTLPSLDHDRNKQRLIAPEGKSYLYSLGITDAKGHVLKNSQDKFRQINKYVEILSGLIKHLPPDRIQKIVDMGAGKGYLTFALYDYLQTCGHKTDLIGVEYRPDLVNMCNEIAKNTGFDHLTFHQGTVMDFDCTDANIVIALHACDTATDDALFKGIKAGADLIVVAPCCHKQIRREMEQNKTQNELDFLIKHGTFLERQAEMITDGIRALILEYCGYSTKVFEFISDVHTPKNVMIVGTKQKPSEVKNQDILDQIKSAKSFFGIKTHYLEKILKLS